MGTILSALRRARLIYAGVYIEKCEYLSRSVRGKVRHCTMNIVLPLMAKPGFCILLDLLAYQMYNIF